MNRTPEAPLFEKSELELFTLPNRDDADTFENSPPLGVAGGLLAKSEPFGKKGFWLLSLGENKEGVGDGCVVVVLLNKPTPLD